MNELANSIDCTDTVLHFLNTLEESNHLDYGYLKDVLTDVSDLLLPERSTIGAAYDGIGTNINASVPSSSGTSSSSSLPGVLTYPFSDPIGASVMCLPDPDIKSNDPFMEMLAASYNATRRNHTTDIKTPNNSSSSSSSSSMNHNDTVKKTTSLSRPSLTFTSPTSSLSLSSSTNGTKIVRRMNLVDQKDRIIILEFTNENDYWRLIRAIKRTLKDENQSIVHICRSSWPRGETSRSPGTPLQDTTSSSSSSSSSLPIMHTCQVVGGEIKYDSGKDNECIDLRSMKALTVSWDYLPVSKYVLKTYFSLAGTLEKLIAIVQSTTTTTTTTMATASSSSSSSSTTHMNELKLGESCIIQLHSDEELKSIELNVKICDKKADDISNKTTNEFMIFPFGQATMKPTANYDLRYISSDTNQHQQGNNPFLIPFVYKIPLEIPLSMRAVRTIIHSAEGLVCNNNNKPPSAYASVYLLGDQDEQYYLTAKTKETKTIAISNNTNPIWEQEFILHGPKGLEGATALRVKLKDSGTGYFSGRDNNLGQITIPSTCFVPETVATLTLPIEPTTTGMITMNKNDYGEIKVSTELVVISQLLQPLLSKQGIEEMDLFKRGNGGSGNCDSSYSLSPKILPRETISSIGEGHIYCTVHRTGEYDVWKWPCKISDPTKESLSCCIWGHVFCRYDALYIHIDPTEIRKNGFDSIIAKDTSWNHHNNNDMIHMYGKTLRIPWMEVRSIDMLTPSTAQMTLECHNEYGFASCIDRKEIDILIAPCPASGLTHLVRDRVTVSHLRSELKSFLSTIISTKNETESERVDRETTGAWSDEVILSVARSILGSIAHGILSFRAKMYFAQLLEGCRELKSGRPDLKSVRITVQNDLLRAQEGVKYYAEDWNDVISNNNNNNNNNNKVIPISVIIERIRVLVDYSIVQLRNFILFSAGPTKSSTNHFSIEESNVSNNIAGSKNVIIELVKEYHITIMNMLDPFISNINTFRSIEGQNDKTNIIKFLIKENYLFHSIIEPPLKCMNIDLDKPALLVEEQQLDMILDWYTQTISTETKAWLAKTIANAWTIKQNKFDLPWDVIEIRNNDNDNDNHHDNNQGGNKDISKHSKGQKLDHNDNHNNDNHNVGLYVSTIPETYRYQMNVYLDLCSERPQPRYNGYEVDTDEITRVLQMNDKILKAIAGALCLLADEYKVALQSKHWSTGMNDSSISSPTTTTTTTTMTNKPSNKTTNTSEDEASAQLHFLVSVINDSYRLSTIHLQPLKDVETTSSVSIYELIKSITNVFDGVIDTAINHVVRTMFSDLNTALVNFESLWIQQRENGSTNGTPLTIITTTLSDYFNGLFGRIEIKYFAMIVTICLDTCVMRYLIFLRDYAHKKNKKESALILSSKKDATRFAIDCANLKTCFLCPALPLDVTLRDVLNQKLTSVTNLVDIITQDYEGEHCQEIIHAIAKKYNGPQYKSIGANVLAITSSLRIQTVGNAGDQAKLEYQRLINNILDQYENQDFETEYIVNMEYGEAKVTKQNNYNSNNGHGGGYNNNNNNNNENNGHYLPPSDFYLRLFADKDSSSNNNNNNNDHSHSKMDIGISSSSSLNDHTMKTPGSTIKKPKQLLSSATKALRENVSDMNVFSAFSKKAKAKQKANRSQDKLLELQRELGLGGVASTNKNDHEIRSAHDNNNNNNNNGSVSDHYPFSADGGTVASYGNGGGNRNDPDGESIATGMETNSLAGVQAELFAGMDNLPLNEQCIVCIEQIKVRNIKSSSLFGKSNPYVAFSLGSHRIKTPVIWGTNEPVWETKVLGTNFHFYAPRESLHQLRMSVKVFDKERIRRKRLLGSVSIGLSTLNLRPIKSFFAMEAGESGSTSKSAEIFVHISVKDR